MSKRLYRSVQDRRIGGVAAGTAEYFDIDPSIARVLWVLLAIFTGGGFLIVYLVMWAVVPEEPWDPDTIVGTASVPGQAPSGDAAPAETRPRAGARRRRIGTASVVDAVIGLAAAGPAGG